MNVLQSRRLWTLIIAGVVNIVSLVIGHYITDPFALQMAAALIGLFNAIAGILVVSYTVDDIKGNNAQRDIEIAAVQAGTHPDYPAK